MESNLEWPEDLQLATDVVVGYVDICSAGLRALKILQEFLSGQGNVSKKYVGKIKNKDRSGFLGKAWKDKISGDCSEAAFEVCTFYDGEMKPALSMIWVNAMLPSESVTGIAIDLIQGLLSQKVSSPGKSYCS
jgi:hypothetical protein